MPAATQGTGFRDALHAIALDKMRRKGSGHYRWWLLGLLAFGGWVVWWLCG